MVWTREKLYEEVYNLIVDTCLSISPDAKDLLQQSLKKETNETAKSMLQTMLDDVDMAKKLNKPVCQSPGFGTVYVSFSNTALLKDIKEIYSQAIIEATKNGFLRPSMVHSLTRKNPGDNSGIGVPNFEFIYKPEQEYVEHILSFKGCGAELGNAMKITHLNIVFLLYDLSELLQQDLHIYLILPLKHMHSARSLNFVLRSVQPLILQYDCIDLSL